MQPPKIEPTRAAFGLPERCLISADQIVAADVLSDRGDLSDDRSDPAVNAEGRKNGVLCDFRNW
ncbi:MAG: hypothetical protein WA705_16660 [Candidatus Ozemobacteraceae bacterium]